MVRALSEIAESCTESGSRIDLGPQRSARRGHRHQRGPGVTELGDGARCASISM